MKKVVLSLIMLAVFAAGSYATEQGKFNVGFNPGLAFPLSDFKDQYGTSLSLGFSGDYQFTDLIAAGMELQYNVSHGMSDKQQKDIAALANVAVDKVSGHKGKLFQIGPYAKIGKEMDKGSVKFRPYGIAGFGIYSFSFSDYEIAGNNIPDTTNGQTKFGLNFGGGTDFTIADDWTLGLDLRLHFMFTEGTTTKYFLPTVRLNYKF